MSVPAVGPQLLHAAMPLDPYYTWLGIPPDEQPPNHYRLLGINLFEGNLSAIEHAADRQMAHIRTFQTGPQAAASQQLLREIALARICLLDPERKAAYDAALRQSFAVPAAIPLAPLPLQPAIVPPPQPVAMPVQAASPVAVERRAPPPQPRSPRRGKDPLIEIVKIVLGGAVGLLLAVLLLRYVLLIDVTGLLPIADQRDQRPPAVQQAAGDAQAPLVAADRDAPHPASQAEGAATREPAQPGAESASSAGSGAELAEADPAETPVPHSPEAIADSASPLVEETHEAAGPATVANVLAPRRLAIPPAEDQAAVKQKLEEVYELSKLKDDAAKLAAAGELMKVAREPSVGDADRFVALRTAAELAQEAGDARPMVAAIDALAQRFDIDLLRVETMMIEEFARRARNSAAVETLVEAVQPAIEFALADGDYEAAKRLADAALAACNKPVGLRHRKPVADVHKVVAERHKAWLGYQAARAALEADPNNPAANLAAGKWLVLERGDWPAALPHLARAGNDLLRAAVEAESQAAAPEAQLAAADAWYDAGMATPREPLWLVRALVWYSRPSRTELSGLAAAKVDRRLEELRKDDKVAELAQAVDQAAALGSVTHELAPIARRHCALLFRFEPDDVFLADGKPMLRDLSGRGNHGLIAGPTLAPGQSGQAFQFDGVDDFVECISDNGLNPTEGLTICAWVKPQAWISLDNPFDNIISKDDDGRGGSRGYVLRFAHGGQLEMVTGHGARWNWTRTADRQPLNEWVHVAGVYDRKHYALLVNGVERGRAPFTEPISPSPFKLRVGRGTFAPGRRFHGLIDEVAVFNIALTAEDVQTIYQLGAEGRPLSR